MTIDDVINLIHEEQTFIIVRKNGCVTDRCIDYHNGAVDSLVNLRTMIQKRHQQDQVSRLKGESHKQLAEELEE